MRQLQRIAEERRFTYIAEVLRECLETDPDTPRTAWVRDAIMNVLHLREGTSISFFCVAFMLRPRTIFSLAADGGNDTGQSALNREAHRIQLSFRSYKARADELWLMSD